MPMEMRSASTSSGKIAAISAAPTPVTSVDTCGVLKRGWQRLMAAGSRPSSAIERDRKSTRLNSSHSQISYAVFCLKKKKKVLMKGTSLLSYFIDLSPSKQLLHT